MKSIYWEDNGDFATLYINGKQHATIHILRDCEVESDTVGYGLTATVENRHYYDHDLRVESMVQAKNTVLMMMLKAMDRSYAEHTQKVTELFDIVRTLNGIARFEKADVLYEDIDIDVDGTLSCQIAGPIMGKLNELYGLKVVEGVWYNLYACYNPDTETVCLIYTYNDDTSSTEHEIETTEKERDILKRLLCEYIEKEEGCSISAYLNNREK